MCPEVGTVAGVAALQTAVESSAREIGRLWKMERTPFSGCPGNPGRHPGGTDIGLLPSLRAQQPILTPSTQSSDCESQGLLPQDKAQPL